MAHCGQHPLIAPALQPLSLFIGLRYTLAKRSNRFISFISLASMLGIAVGITALITVMSVMNGFQKEVRASILGVASHIQVNGDDDRLADWKNVQSAVRSHPEVTGAAPFVNGQGLLSGAGNVRGVVVRGILPGEEKAVSDLGKNMRVGNIGDLRPGEYGMVLGADLARILQVQRGDKLQLMIPQGSVTPIGNVPRMRSFTVVGTVNTGHYEYDSTLAVIHLADAQTLFRLADAVSGVRVKLRDVDSAPRIAREIARLWKGEGYVSDWTQQNATYFKAVQLEKRMMFVILALIIAVAAFNLVSTLVMVVTDKQPQIAILRTLGASPAMITRIFVVQGAVIGVFGTLLGVAGGVLLALNISSVIDFLERLFHFQLLPRDIYFVQGLPSDLHGGDVTAVAVVALVMALVATLYPSWQASQVNPAEALRHE
ncbi:MAG: lipoprotein-releasing ABC transporter permease subunit [Betaproteobacteria bacterium]|nr:lipoprotein-releasing ABC transporter permease subunit [Betaproteobacteria bacterium]